MNLSLISLEIGVVALGMALLLADLWLPPERRRVLGYAAAAGLGLLLVANVAGFGVFGGMGTAFGGMFVQDALAVFFKRFFLVAAILVLLVAVEFSDRISAGIAGVLFADPFRFGGDVVCRFGE